MNDKPIEAEVVPTQAVATRPPSGMPTVADLEQSFMLAIRQRELLSDYIKKQLKPGKHYYQRGDQKPSLAKEGAEIILLPHNLAPDYEQTGGPAEPPDGDRPYQITVKCVLRAKGQLDSFVGSGIGSAGSHKGYWEKSGPRKGEWVYQPRQTDRYLCHNATLKMAQKSAMIAATINSTAASEFFTQDMEGEATGGPPPAPRETNPPPPIFVPQKHRFPTPATRNWMLNELHALHPGDPGYKLVLEYFQKVNQLLPTEILGDLPLRYVPSTRKELEQLVNCIANFEAGGDAVAAFEPHPEEDNVPMDGPTPLAAKDSKPIEVPRENVDTPEKVEVWRRFPMPFGKNAGIALEDLEKNYLYGLWANYEVEMEYKGKPRKKEKIETDQKFRAMLDLAGEHYQFKKND